MIVYAFLLSVLRLVFGYKPVVIVHGILSDAEHMKDLISNILECHPNTNVTSLHLYPGIESFIPLQDQIEHWKEKIIPVMQEAPDGIHLICHSQGGLVCQGIIESYDNHNVDTFISLSSPLMGQFGVTSYITRYFPWMKKEREELTNYMYTALVQEAISISNYWRDPRKEYHQPYLDESRYLPIIQNDPNCPRVNAEDAKRYKQNFLKLKKLVLIGGPDDGVITPWQSSNFGFYDENYNVVGMKNHSMYKEDWFGLRTLYERGGVVMNSILNVKHVEWHGNKAVFKGFIEPHLT